MINWSLLTIALLANDYGQLFQGDQINAIDMSGLKTI